MQHVASDQFDKNRRVGSHQVLLKTARGKVFDELSCSQMFFMFFQPNLEEQWTHTWGFGWFIFSIFKHDVNPVTRTSPQVMKSSFSHHIWMFIHHGKVFTKYIHCNVNDILVFMIFHSSGGIVGVFLKPLFGWQHLPGQVKGKSKCLITEPAASFSSIGRNDERDLNYLPQRGKF